MNFSFHVPALGPFTSELDQVFELLEERLERDSPPYARHLLRHFPLNSGQMIRPALVLTAGAVSRASTKAARTGKKLLVSAAAVELIHNGSLLHDDVIDNGRMRRHCPTINLLFGTREAVLLGDFFLSRAFTLIEELRSVKARGSVSRLIREMVDGELLELGYTAAASATVEDAVDIIKKKTGALFAEACFLGGIQANLDSAQLEALRDFGLSAGTSYQIIDDLLDITATSTQLGKDAGSDILHGKPSLPLVYALSLAPRELSLDLQQNRPGGMGQLAKLLHTPSVRKYCLDFARSFANEAENSLSVLPDCPAKDALQAFSGFTWKRATR